MERFKNKVVLVTGGSRGLGAAIVWRFAQEGAHVAINYLKNAEAADDLRDEIKHLGGKAITIQADVGNEEEVKHLMTTVVAEFGSIDVLVNNAGVVSDIPFIKKSSEIWQRTLDVNLNGVYFCTKHALPHINMGGSIINISSTNGIDTYHPDSVDYDVSKAGVIMFSKAMARDLAPNIRINCIAPGWFDTDMNTELPNDYLQGEMAKIALGRFGKPEEIANVAAFLASEDASFITGSVVVVDGGYGGAV